jgi:hypothetical protein
VAGGDRFTNPIAVGIRTAQETGLLQKFSVGSWCLDMAFREDANKTAVVA